MVSAWVPTSVPVLTSLSGGLDCVSGNLLSPSQVAIGQSVFKTYFIYLVF